jgi:uncharacterized protein
MQKTLLALAAATCALAACKSPPTSFYTLSPDAALEHAGAAVTGAVVVGPVTVPDLVDRPQIVTRVSGNEVTINEFARWGEPLRSNIAATLAGDLARLLGSARVSVSAQTVAGTEAWRVRVDIVQFDATPGDSVAVDAMWTVKMSGRTALLTGRSTVRELAPGTGFDALVAAQSRALASVSRDIAGAIQQAR